MFYHRKNTEPEAFKIIDRLEEAENIRTFVFKGTLHSKPGQFCMLWIPGIDEKPFSMAQDSDGEIHLTVCKVGPLSEKLYNMEIGESVGLRGALGAGFTIPEKPQKVVLIGGGYGTAPLHFAGTEHKKQGSEVTMIIGARNKRILIWEEKCKKSGFRTIITTNDGSRGQKGFTTDALKKILEKEEVTLVQTCGPEIMMKIIAEICQEKNIRCEVSIERYMKCGFGICGQCVTESGEKMCQNGPVVPSKRALKYEDFGVFHRDSVGRKINW